jgi:hypothetical protein
MENVLVKLEMSEIVLDEKMEGIDEKNAEVMTEIKKIENVKEKIELTKKSSNVKFVKPPYGKYLH